MAQRTQVCEWQRALDGEVHARATLVRRYHQELRLFVAGRCPRESLIEAIVHRCLVQALSMEGGPPPGRGFRDHLQSQARHEWHRALRDWCLTAIESQDALSVSITDACRDAEASAWEPPPPHHLERCLHRLGPYAQALVRRRYIDAVPLADMAAGDTRSAGALAAHLHRIRRALGAGLREIPLHRIPLLPRPTALALETWLDRDLAEDERTALHEALQAKGGTAVHAVADLCLSRVLACHLRPPAPNGVVDAVHEALEAIQRKRRPVWWSRFRRRSRAGNER